MTLALAEAEKNIRSAAARKFNNKAYGGFRRPYFIKYKLKQGVWVCPGRNRETFTTFSCHRQAKKLRFQKDIPIRLAFYLLLYKHKSDSWHSSHLGFLALQTLLP